MILLIVLLLAAAPAAAQELTYRGFAQVQSAAYPQTTPQDDERVAAQARIRFEPALRMASWITLEGSIEARADNLELVEREWRLDTRDRGGRRPAFSLRHADLRLRRNALTVDHTRIPTSPDSPVSLMYLRHTAMASGYFFIRA